jgi:hypothetical protein
MTRDPKTFQAKVRGYIALHGHVIAFSGVLWSGISNEAANYPVDN